MRITELKKILMDLRFHLREKQKRKWNRSLPFEEELFDRWERAKFLGFGENTSIYQSSLVFGDVKIGKDTWIGPFTVLDGSGKLEIGDNCSISSGAQIYTHDSIDKRVSNHKGVIKREKTVIKNSCYIGPLSVIKKGITIGNNSIIGALSYVNKDVSPFTIVAGTPAKVVGKIKLTSNGNIEYLYNKKEDNILLKKEVKKIKEKLLKIEKRLKNEK